MTSPHRLFHSPTHGQLPFPQVVDRIHFFIQQPELYQYKTIVGTDSTLLRNGLAEFATAIVVQRIGHGAIYFVQHQQLTQMHVLERRMFQEALLSIEVGQRLLGSRLPTTSPLSRETLEIHTDIGQHGPTRSMIQAITGMVRGHGFAVRFKPDSYAASSVADRHTP